MNNCELRFAVGAPLRGCIDRFSPRGEDKDAVRPLGMPPCVIAIGKFDGIHSGHRALLSEVVDEARRRGLQAGVVTFDAHPRQVLFGERHEALTTLSERRRLLQDCGLDFQLLLHARPDLFSLDAEDFARHLIRVVNCKAVVVGANFRFGRRAAGDCGTLRRLGLDVLPLSLLAESGAIVSSTSIREALRAGEVEHAAQLLGRPYGLYGALRGSGSPRWSMAPAAGLLVPAAGVYRGQVIGEGDERAWPVLLRVPSPGSCDGIDLVSLDLPPWVKPPYSRYGRVLFEGCGVEGLAGCSEEMGVASASDRWLGECPHIELATSRVSGGGRLVWAM